MHRVGRTDDEGSKLPAGGERTARKGGGGGVIEWGLKLSRLKTENRPSYHEIVASKVLVNRILEDWLGARL